VQGTDSLRTRLDLVSAAERTLDLQYFTVQSDTTGQLLIHSVLRAADRGVRVRLLIDDTDDMQRDRQVIALAAHPRIELRLFNPFYTRGVLDLLRYAEFIVAGQRLNYRMHNKVFIVDNAAAVVGGRNVGDEYFQASARMVTSTYLPWDRWYSRSRAISTSTGIARRDSDSGVDRRQARPMLSSSIARNSTEPDGARHRCVFTNLVTTNWDGRSRATDHSSWRANCSMTTKSQGPGRRGRRIIAAASPR
jgi:phosphatidylserine/phosphatidylglycerophosphate/cardiolipin synthase-like enzyme